KRPATPPISIQTATPAGAATAVPQLSKARWPAPIRAPSLAAATIAETGAATAAAVATAIGAVAVVTAEATASASPFLTPPRLQKQRKCRTSSATTSTLPQSSQQITPQALGPTKPTLAKAHPELMAVAAGA